MSVLPSLALALAAGILAADVGSPPPWSAWPVAGAALALGWRAGRSPRRRMAAALLLAFAAGVHLQARPLAEARRAASDPPRDVVLEARVAESASPLRPARVTLEDVRGVEGAAPRRLHLYAGEPDELAGWMPGDRVRLSARIAPLRPARNPGRTDPAHRAWRSGVGAVARLRHPGLQAHLVSAGWSPRRRLHALRRRVARGLGPGRGAGLLRGLALGDRSALAPEVRDAFTRLGLGHSLAVSGLHLAWVAALAFAVSRRLLGRSAALAARWDTRRLALGPAALAALGYAALAGWGVPVRRALVLLAAAAVALARRRPQASAPALAGAALWILVREPQALFEAGAQLSFGAVAALLAVARRSGAGSGPGWRVALQRSATALLATAPLAAWHGLGVAPLALVANVLFLPWLGGVVLPAALASAVAISFRIPGASWILYIGVRIAALSIHLLERAAAWAPEPSAGPPAFPWWLGAAVLAGLGLTARGTAGRIAAVAGVTFALAAAPPRSVSPPPPRLVVLDVGQGDAALVQGRRGAVLIDTGGLRPDGWDAGRAHVVPALRALGVARLDLLVVTHADADHRGGALTLLASLPVGEVWLPWGGGSEPAFDELRAAARRAGVPVRERGRGSPVRRFGDLRVDPLWPPRPAGDGSRNARSLVVAVEAGGRRVLAPGDLDALAEAELASRGAGLAADVLLVPHHGSGSSSSRSFLGAVDPVLAVVSTPCRSRFHMPHPRVRARIARGGAPLWWTGRDGAVLVHLGRTLWVRSVGAPRGDCGAQDAGRRGWGAADRG